MLELVILLDRMDQIPLALSPAIEPEFGNFVPGGNAEALTSVREFASGRMSESIIYLWGEPGSGRTHLLRAAQGVNARLVTADDVETLGPGDQQALFVAINAAREGGAPVLAAGASAPSRLPVRDDLRTRLAWGLVYRMRPLSDEEKRTHLRQQAQMRGLRLGEDVISYLLTRLPRGMGDLKEVLEVLDRYSLATKRSLSLPLVREALARTQQAAQSPRQSADR